jgi:hypothetical protein
MNPVDLPPSWKCTDDLAISSGVIALFVFSVFAPGGQAKNQTELKFGLWVTLT